jgi:hypothetical protein
MSTITIEADGAVLQRSLAHLNDKDACPHQAASAACRRCQSKNLNVESICLGQTEIDIFCTCPGGAVHRYTLETTTDAPTRGCPSCGGRLLPSGVSVVKENGDHTVGRRCRDCGIEVRNHSSVEYSRSRGVIPLNETTWTRLLSIAF